MTNTKARRRNNQHKGEATQRAYTKGQRSNDQHKKLWRDHQARHNTVKVGENAPGGASSSSSILSKDTTLVTMKFDWLDKPLRGLLVDLFVQECRALLLERLKSLKK